MNEIEKTIQELNLIYFQKIRKILTKNAYMFTNFTESTPKQDMEEGFDAIFTFADVKIPIRIRQYKYVKYRDITIRSRSKYGIKTEIDKIRDGMGDYYFYCWENKNRNGIYCYVIFDMKKFVSTGIINKPDIEDKENYDGTCFNCYSLEKLILNDIIIIYELL